MRDEVSQEICLDKELFRIRQDVISLGIGVGDRRRWFLSKTWRKLLYYYRKDKFMTSAFVRLSYRQKH